MSMAGDKFSLEDWYIMQADLLYQAREEIKRLQRQVDRLGKDKAKLQSQLLEALAQVSKVVSDAGWQAEYNRQEALGREERGWK